MGRYCFQSLLCPVRLAPESRRALSRHKPKAHPEKPIYRVPYAQRLSRTRLVHPSYPHRRSADHKTLLGLPRARQVRHSELFSTNREWAFLSCQNILLLHPGLPRPLHLTITPRLSMSAHASQFFSPGRTNSLCHPAPHCELHTCPVLGFVILFCFLSPSLCFWLLPPVIAKLPDGHAILQNPTPNPHPLGPKAPAVRYHNLDLAIVKWHSIPKTPCDRPCIPTGISLSHSCVSPPHQLPIALYMWQRQYTAAPSLGAGGRGDNAPPLPAESS